MQYMNDPTLHVPKRDERGLDVNDITGKRKTLTGPGSLPPSGPIDRAQPVRPRVMEYDIINPLPSDQRLRMSNYGKHVLSSRQQERSSVVTGSPAAGKKQLAKMGEANIDQIWPADEQLRNQFDEKNRSLQIQDINQNKFNPRMQKLKQQDTQRIQQLMASKQRSSEGGPRPYKNASNVFVHLIDDPTTRQKVGKHNSSMAARADPLSDRDLLDRLMAQDGQRHGQALDAMAAQDLANREFQPLDLNAQNGDAQQVGRPSNADVPKGKRAYTKDHMTVVTGQARLFGGERGEQAQSAFFDEGKKGGKRIISMPQQASVNLFK